MSVTFVVIVLPRISVIVSLLFAIEDTVAQFAPLWSNRLVAEDVLRASVARYHERRRFELSTVFCFEPLVLWVDHVGRLRELRQILRAGVEVQTPTKTVNRLGIGAAFSCLAPSSHRVSTSEDPLVSISIDQRRPVRTCCGWIGRACQSVGVG